MLPYAVCSMLFHLAQRPKRLTIVNSIFEFPFSSVSISQWEAAAGEEMTGKE